MDVQERAGRLGLALHSNEWVEFDADACYAEALAAARDNDKRAGRDADGREALYYGGIAPSVEARDWWPKRGRDWTAANHEKNGGEDGYAYADGAACLNVVAFAWFRSNPDAPDPAETWARAVTNTEVRWYKRHGGDRYVLVTKDNYIAWFVPRSG